MNSLHKGYIWGLLFSLPVVYTSQALAQYEQTAALESSYQSIDQLSLKNTNLWDGTVYGSEDEPKHGSKFGLEFGLEPGIIWEVVDNKRGYRHKRYEELSPEQRKKLKQRRDDFNALPQEEQNRIHRARDKFRNMPPEKREKLKEKWRNMSPEERDKAHKNRTYKNEYHQNKGRKNKTHNKVSPTKKKYRPHK